MSIRRFRVPVGRMVTLPNDLTEGNANARIQGPETIDIDSSRIGVHSRFLANRIKLGDLVEIDHDPSSPATAGAHLETAELTSQERLLLQSTPQMPAAPVKG